LDNIGQSKLVPSMKIANPTLYAYKILKEKIIERIMEPGIKINQNDLAEEIGVSRTPIVKALSKLESDGLVDNIPNRGFYVHQTTVQELLEFYTLREALEIIIINEIIEKANPEKFQELEEFFLPYNGEWTPEKLKDYYIADQRFHRAIISMCTNRIVLRINDLFQVYNRTFLAGVIRNPDDTLREHKILIKALREKDFNTARSVAVQHTTPTRDALQNLADQMHKLGIDPATLSIQSLKGAPGNDNRLVWI